MREIRFDTSGTPAKVAYCAEVPDPFPSSEDAVLVKVDAFPINPADLLLFRGIYPRNPENGTALGNEATGIVEAVGTAVREVAPGDRVISLRTGNWRDRLVLRESELIRLATGIPRDTAAVLKVNPATAFLLLQEFVALAPGDWILQNAATSAVGRALIAIAAQRGLHTLNVVRRPEVAEELHALGADHVLVASDDLPAQVAEITGGAPVRLAIDAVGGNSSGQLTASLTDGGTLITYGAMSGQPMQLDPGQIVFKDLRIRGFWLTKFLSDAPRDQIVDLYDTLGALALDGTFRPKISGQFEISRITDALAHAEATIGQGKTLVTP